MGKAKKRILHKTNSNLYMTRETAVSKVTDIIKRSIIKETKTVSSLITLFGLSAEELSEAGVPYENLIALSNIMQEKNRPVLKACNFVVYIVLPLINRLQSN